MGGLGTESVLGSCGCWCRGRCPLGTHTLRLTRAQPADSGTYLCEALNAAGRDQKTVQLNVLGTSYPTYAIFHSSQEPPGKALSPSRDPVEEAESHGQTRQGLML